MARDTSKIDVNPCHAAALAFVGWYLMVPPWSGPHSFDVKAPFATWEQIDVYDSAAECSHYRVKEIELTLVRN
jgi:hypothetical protein